jgi:CRISPR-associated protein (TIGR02584 family)
MEPMRVLCVSGMSPAIVTETVWALCMDAARDVRICEVVVMTTLDGAKQRTPDRDKLWRDVEAQLALMAADWPELAPRLEGVAVRVEVVKDAAGVELADVRTSAELARLELLLRELIYAFTLDGQPRLHASLAGGRKTMSYYTGSLMSLFARDEDGVSHVLVGQDWAEQTGFWYPLPVVCEAPRAQITGRDGVVHHASEATIELCEVPLIRLRLLLGKKLTRENILKYSFDDLIRLAQHEVDPGPQVVVSRDDWSIWVDGEELTGLSPTEHLVLARALVLHSAGQGASFSLLELCAVGAGDALEQMRRARHRALASREDSMRRDTEAAKWESDITLFDASAWGSDEDAQREAARRLARTRTDIATKLGAQAERLERWLALPNVGKAMIKLSLSVEQVELIG